MLHLCSFSADIFDAAMLAMRYMVPELLGDLTDQVVRSIHYLVHLQTCAPWLVLAAKRRLWPDVVLLLLLATPQLFLP